MRFEDAIGGLSAPEQEALRVLESSGWQIGLDCKLEDMTKPDGNRRRTYSNTGRYAVAVFLKNLSSREPVEVPAFPAAMSKPEPEPTVVEVVSVSAGISVEPEVEVEKAPELEPEPEAKKPAKTWGGKKDKRR